MRLRLTFLPAIAVAQNTPPAIKPEHLGDTRYLAAGSGSRGGKPELDSLEIFALPHPLNLSFSSALPKLQ